MQDDTLILGQLAEEFTGRVRKGDLPDIEEYAKKHPPLAERIHALFPTLMLLEGMASGTIGEERARTMGIASGIAPGTSFGPYRIEREIGRGGMGIVYEATHLALEKRVALKVLPIVGPRGAGHLERFFREAKTAAALHHTNIVPVFDVGQFGGIPYYAMQHIEGKSLDRVLKEIAAGARPTGPEEVAGPPRAAEAGGPTRSIETRAPNEPVPVEKGGGGEAMTAPRPRDRTPTPSPDHFRWVAKMGLQAAEGLAHAHQRGVVHRDIKPSNLILGQEGVLWITDFGLARQSDDPALTHSGALLGTPRYMSPEQAAGARKPVDHRSDIYSLGATIYELLTCRPAFEGKTPQEILTKIVDRQPVAPRRVNPAIPRDLETIVMKCLQKEPEGRYESSSGLAGDLRRYLAGEPILARRVGPVEAVLKWSRRRPAVAALVGVSTLAVISLLCVSIYFNVRLGEERDTARSEREHARLQKVVAQEERDTARHRLWQTLIEQARVERLSGNRWRSLELIGEASRIKSEAGLRDEAIQTLALPGLRLVCELPCGESSGGPQERVRFSPDSKLLAAPAWTYPGSEPFPDPVKQIRLWRIPSGDLVKTSGVEVQSADDFEFSPDGSLLAIANRANGTVQVWDLGDERERELKYAAGPLAFGPDGSILAFRGPSGVRIWNETTKTEQSTGAVGLPLRFLDDDRLLLSQAEGRGPFKVWDLAADEEVFSTGDEMYFAGLSANGRVAALTPKGEDTGRGVHETPFVEVWDLDAGKRIDRFEHRRGPIRRVALTRDGALLAFRDSDPDAAKIWDVFEGRLRRTIVGLGRENRGLSSAGLSPDGSFLATFTGSPGFMQSGAKSRLGWYYSKRGRPGLRVWEVETGREVAHLADAHTPSWSADGRYLAALVPGEVDAGGGARKSERCATIQVWEVMAPVSVRRPTTSSVRYTRPVESISFHPRDERVALNDTIWSVAGPADFRSLSPVSRESDGGITCFTGEGASLSIGRGHWRNSSVTDPLILRRSDPPGGEVALEDPGYAEMAVPKDQDGILFAIVEGGFALSPDGRTAAIARTFAWGRRVFKDGRLGGASGSGWPVYLELWDLEERRRTAVLRRTGFKQAEGDAEKITFLSGGVSSEFVGCTCLVFGADGTRLLVGDLEGVDLWDVQGKKRLWRLEVAKPVRSLVLTPDSRLAFVGPEDGDIRVVTVEDGLEQGIWSGHAGAVFALALTPDGGLLASGGQDHRICLWEVPAGRRVVRWEAHDHVVTALAFSPDGAILISGATDGTAKLWNLPQIRKELGALSLDWK